MRNHKRAVCCSHEAPLYFLDSKTFIIKKIIKYLKPRINDFDAIAISGYSSAMIGPIIAEKLKKNIVLIRKPSEERISSYDVEGQYNQRCIYIDDCISSGSTLDRVKDGLFKMKSSFEGIVLYNDEYKYKNNEYRGVKIWYNFCTNADFKLT